MSYQNYKWEILAKDYNSPLFRNYIWVAHPFMYPKLFGIRRPVIGILSERNRITYIADLASWEMSHEDLVAKVKKDFLYVGRLIDTTNRLGKQMNTWSEKQLFKRDLSRLSNKQLFKLYEKTSEWIGVLYAHGVLLPILDFGDHLFVEDNLKKILLKFVSGEEYTKYYRVFTEPVFNSFAKDQEVALLKLAREFYKNDKWRKAAANDSLEETAKKFPIFYAKLLRHAKKWGWVYYVYAGPAFGTEQFFDFIKSYFKKGINPAESLKEFKRKRAENEKLKREFITRFKPDRFSKSILTLAGKLVWAKPRRKDYQSRTYFHSEKLLIEIGTRLSLSLSEARSASPLILKEALLKNKPVDKNLIASAYDLHLCLPNDNGSVEVLIGKEVEEFRSNHMRRAQENIFGEMKEIKGTPACLGNARGVVKIVNVPEDMIKMNQGDILVSTATTPSIVPAMKKAAAIVSDEGGLTCHAAIVSRELGTPCIVGTKIATKVLKDGDLVEVDADKGVIKILNK